MGSGSASASRSVAVIGMAGRFPGAESVEQLWRNLTRGVESISRFSRQEMLAEGVPAEEIDDPSYVPAGGALPHPDRFAASFFGYSPREALIMDPQQRLFLECSWEALESAGYGDPASYNPVGVFAAVSLSTYLLNRLVPRRDLIEKIVDIETTIGNDKDFLASRVAYKLDLRGPTVVVQSACSSSLVATHLARQALLAGDCDIALAGGSSVDVPQRAGYLYKPDGIYSADGHCRPFDARANGMVGGSGCAVVVLKRLDRAIADGDTVHAVIRGSAVNNDGANKVGYSAPSVDAQARVVAAAQAAAGTEAASIGYVEAHGTATALGDPIEVEALSEAFGDLPAASCVLGAVKSNLGHLNAAAGVTGLIKAVLTVREGRIPPTLHFTRPNPHIDLERTPFWVNVETIDWPRADGPRRAGVSSFGMGGTNAHVIVEQPPDPPERPPRRDVEPGLEIVTLSARVESALDRSRQRLADHLGTHPELELADVAHTLRAGRKAFSQRLAVLAGSVDELLEKLAGGSSKITGAASTSPPAVAFLFPGQGAQHPGMAAAIGERFPTFHGSIVDGCSRLGGDLGAELERLLLATGDDAEAAQRLEQTELAQPALFLLQHSLARLWQSLGVRPGSMIGHSIGEYTAACLAGVFSLSDALVLVRERGRLLQSMPPGSMLAVHAEEAEIRSRLGDRLVVAAINEPSSCVVSGPTEEIEALARRLEEEGIASTLLKTSHAFHSPLVEEAAEPLREVVAGIRLSAPEVPFVSNVSGTWITAEEATDPGYWSRHLLEPVRFSRGLETLLAGGASVLLEVGPGTTLSSLARRHPARRGAVPVASLPHPRQRGDAARHLLEAIARLWTGGVRIDWEAFSGGGGRRIQLPTYPFERQRYWIEPVDPSVGSPAGGKTRRHPDDWFYLPSWRRIGSPRGIRERTETDPVLVLRPDSVAGETVTDEIAASQPIVDVVAGDSFEQLSDTSFRLDPRRGDHFDALLSALGEPPRRVVHLWSLPDDDRPRDRRRGFDSLLVLAQALHPAAESLDLVCLTATSQEVTGEETPDPWQALVLGPCRVIPFERAGWRARIVDLEPDGEALPPGTGGRLLDELAFREEGDLVAYRGRHRWMPSRSQLDPPAPEAVVEALPAGARCLVTGGTSGVGAALAEALFDRYGARLALLSRTPLPERDRWDELLASTDLEPRVRRAIGAVRRLEERGAEVITAAADVADRDGLAAALQSIEERLGGIDLVVHAAGVAGGRALDLETVEGAGRALAAKVDGTVHLYELLVDGSGATLVLCSSLAAEIGGFGQIGYAAANAFQDAFPAAHPGDRVLAIDWDTWSETGMAVDTEVPPALEAARREALSFGLSTAEGQQTFLRLLASGERRVLVSTRPIDVRLAAETPQDVAPEPRSAEAAPAADAAAERPDLSTPFEAPRTEVEERLADIWQRLFGIDRVGVDDDFFELGGHSLLATQLLNRLRKIYPDAKLALATLFDAPTVASLAREVESALVGREADRLPTRQDLLASTAEERIAFLRDYLAERLAADPSFDPEHVDGRAKAAEIVWDLRRDLDLVVYPHELEAAETLDELAETIAGLVRGIGAPRRRRSPGETMEPPATAPSPAASVEKNPGMLFLLSAPRSGSTLMRLMLGGHSELFCPPELALLSASGMRDWKRRQHGIFARDGLTRALIELEGLEPDAALDEIERLVEADLSTQRVYARLQAACGSRQLLDKSPAYALDEIALGRAEALFDTPRYLLLTRHPAAVIESLVRHRMEALLADEPVEDPWRFAESVWRRANRNLLELAERVSERALWVRFEDLVAEPEVAMRRVVGFLGIDFEAALLAPYAGGRMIDGPGDPDIFQHEAIEPELGEAWRHVELPIELDDETTAVAERLGYPLGGERRTSSPEIRAEEADRLLSRIDDLSDEEVEATLSALLAEGAEENESD